MDINNFIGAGLYDGIIKNADGDEFDIHAIVTASGDPERDEIEVKGDDELKGTFSMGLSEAITIEANAISFDVIQEITGNDVSSSATGNEVALGTDSEKNVPFVEVKAYTTAKSADGTASIIEKIWHKVQLSAIKVEQAGENEFKFSCEGRAIPTEEDIEGAALTTKRIATLKAYSAE